MTTATAHPTARSTERPPVRPSRRPTSTTADRLDVRDRAAMDRRLAALADDLERRDRAAIAERRSRRPVVWLTAMTVAAIVTAHLAVVVAVSGL